MVNDWFLVECTIFSGSAICAPRKAEITAALSANILLYNWQHAWLKRFGLKPAFFGSSVMHAGESTDLHFVDEAEPLSRL